MDGIRGVMKQGSFESDFTWANGYADKVINLIRKLAKHFVSIRPADQEADMKWATDYVVTVEGGEIAVRTRRPTCEYRDWTIRSRRISGAETELSKIKKGFARWYLYYWAGNDLDEWMFIDLDEVRRTGLLDKPWPEICNRDGRTAFIRIPIDAISHCVIDTNIHINGQEGAHHDATR